MYPRTHTLTCTHALPPLTLSHAVTYSPKLTRELESHSHMYPALTDILTCTHTPPSHSHMDPRALTHGPSSQRSLTLPETHPHVYLNRTHTCTHTPTHTLTCTHTPPSHSHMHPHTPPHTLTCTHTHIHTTPPQHNTNIARLMYEVNHRVITDYLLHFYKL